MANLYCNFWTSNLLIDHSCSCVIRELLAVLGTPRFVSPSHFRLLQGLSRMYSIYYPHLSLVHDSELSSSLLAASIFLFPLSPSQRCVGVCYRISASHPHLPYLP